MSTIATPRRDLAWTRLAGLAAVPAVIAVLVIAAAGKGLGAASTQQLEPGPGIFLTLVGVAAGAFAWVRLSARTLRRLVPTVVALSIVPDLLLAAGGTDGGAVLTLIVMHLAVAGIAVATFGRLHPRR